MVRVRVSVRVTRDMVGGDGQVSRLLESVDDVEVGQARLDHQDVGALLVRVGVGVRVRVRVRG